MKDKIAWTAKATRRHTQTPLLEYQSGIAAFLYTAEFAGRRMAPDEEIEYADDNKYTVTGDSYVSIKLIDMVADTRASIAQYEADGGNVNSFWFDRIIDNVWKITQLMYARDQKEHDRITRGRQRGGARGAETKRDDLAERNKRIVSALDRGDPVKQIAERHGLSTSQIRRIRREHNRLTRAL